MNTQPGLETIRKTVVEKILKCLEGTAPKESFIELAETLNHTPEIRADIPLLQSATLLDFLSKQLVNGNADFVSPQIVQESCTYMLSKLVPGTPYIS